MVKSKTLLFSVVFPGIEKYLADYFYAVDAQDDKGFDLLIINDDIKNDQINALCKHPVTIIENVNGLKTIPLRMMAIDYAIANDYEMMVFSDADDYFSENRVRLSKEGLRNNDIVFNDLSLINESGEPIENKLFEKNKLNHQIQGVNDLLDCNLLGLAHTAVKVDLLRDFFVPDNILMFDWWMFSFLLMKGATISFVPKVETFYRQHGGNTVGMWSFLTEEKLTFGAAVKKAQYCSLKAYSKKLGKNDLLEKLEEKYAEIMELENNILSTDKVSKYIKAVNENFNEFYKGWWSEILSLERIRPYVGIL